MKNPLRVDPTRTGPLRHQFQSEIERRWKWLETQVHDKVVEQDVFGLVGNAEFHPIDRSLPRGVETWEQIQEFCVQNAKEFKFHTDAKKIPAFREWLKDRIEQGVLTTDAKGEPWTSRYVGSAYRQGLGRAYLDARPQLGQKQEGYDASKRQFLESSFTSPERLSKIQLLATRTFEELRGVSEQMSTQIGRELANGLSNGLSPIQIARGMTKRISGLSKQRARMIAQTEIIHAHAEGALDGLFELGAKGVKAEVEFSSAGDGLVCPKCDELDGKTFTIKEARGKIPVHPNCRCTWIPLGPGDEVPGDETDEEDAGGDDEEPDEPDEENDDEGDEEDDVTENRARKQKRDLQKEWSMKLNGWLGMT